ncbi:MAG: PEGA domain-containing protein [Patescibacteria group bacterium]
MLRLPRSTSFSLALCLLISSVVFLAGCTLPFQKQEVSGLQITTDGITAAVFLNGNKVGMTPYSDQTLKPGSYSVRLEPQDQELATYETSVTLYSTTLAVMNWTFGKTAETSGGIVYELEPLKKKKDANFSLASIPDGAIVKVDDVSQGFTPVLMKSMTPGTHRFQVALPSYKDQEDSINIAEGFQMDVTVKLAKQKVSVTSDDVEVASGAAEASSSAKEASSSSKPTPTPKTESTSRTSQTSSTSTKQVTVIETGTGWLRVRETASATGKELAKVDVGETFPLLDKQDGWDQIEYETGKRGWVSGKYVTEK